MSPGYPITETYPPPGVPDVPPNMLSSGSSVPQVVLYLQFRLLGQELQIPLD